jgi:cell division protein FtsQ
MRISLKCLSLASSAVLLSLFFIFLHDIITQSSRFNAENIIVQGAQTLSKKEIVKQAGVKRHANIFAVNLLLARKKLLLHPWIENAQIERKIPSTLLITIEEHQPLAIIEVGRKYLLNEKGKVFKRLAKSDGNNFPVIKGLEFTDLPLAQRYHFQGYADKGGYAENSVPFRAVMDILRSGAKSGSILPNHTIRRIDVDREIGLTIHAFDNVKTIYLGYDDYQTKYALLKKVFSYLKQKKGFTQYQRIDLMNRNRVVVSPVQF